MDTSFQIVPMFAAGVEVIVFLVIAGISALWNWWQNRNKSDWTKETTPQPGQRPQQKTTDWEDELRRMLEGDQPGHKPTPPPPPVSQPPPVIRHTVPPPP